MTTVVALASITLYLAAAWLLGARLVGAAHNAPGRAAPLLLLVPGVVALALHAMILYDTTLDDGDLRLGVFNAISLIGWVVAALVLFAVHGRPHDNLGVFVLPLAAVSVLLAWLLPPDPSAGAPVSVGIQVHIVVSMLAYGLLALAALQAGFVAAQDRLLREKRWMSVLRALPPLTGQESLLFQLIGAGFFFLSLSLVSGVMFVQDLLAQHLVHKTVLSAVAWLIFGTLLYGRWRHGWRGRAVIRWCLVAFGVLLLAYFGAKLVLEEILGRSWSG